MGWYRNKGGRHVHARTVYLRGALVESDIDLAAKWPEHFDKLHAPPTKQQLRENKRLVIKLEATAPGMDAHTAPKEREKPKLPPPPTEPEGDEGFDDGGAPPAADESDELADPEGKDDEVGGEGEDEPSAEPAKAVEQMSLDELKSFALQNEIDLRGNSTRNGIIKIIKRSGKAG